MAELCAACSGIWPFAHNPLAFVAYFVGKFSPICRGNCSWINFYLAGICFGPGRFVWPGFIGIAVIFVILAGWIGIPAMPADRQNELTVEDGVWQPFSLELLADLRNQKQAVFVDITADWCVTCQVNKQLVLERKPVLQSFAKADVKLLRADWTRPNDMIADYLLKYDRFGIPFNSLYLPDMAEPVIFSEILVAEKIINYWKTACVNLS